MTDDIISATEFQMKSLQGQLNKALDEIKRLERCLENTVYFATIACDLWERSRRNIQAAARGEIEKPVLRLREDL